MIYIFHLSTSFSPNNQVIYLRQVILHIEILNNIQKRLKVNAFFWYYPSCIIGGPIPSHQFETLVLKIRI